MQTIFTKGEVLLLLSAVLFFGNTGCTTNRTITPQDLQVLDSITLKLPMTLYSDDLGSPDFKIDTESNLAYFFSQDDKTLIIYDISKDTFKTINSKFLNGRQHLFNFTLIDSNAWILYANPTYNGGFHDRTIFKLSENLLSPLNLNLSNTMIRTSLNSDTIDYRTSTFLLPLRMEPVWLSDSSVIIPCSYDYIPGTKEYSRLNRGQFIRVFNSESDSLSYYLPIKFSDVVPDGEFYVKSLAQPFGFRIGDSVVFSYGVTNDIYIYSIQNENIESILRKAPLVSRVRSCDTLVDKWYDYSQHQFMYFLHNPYKNEFYRVIKLPDRRGYQIIQMDKRFNEIGLYNVPIGVQWPFHISKRGVYALRKNSFTRDKGYTFIEFKLN